MRIIIIGFMGSGKTTLGKKLAKRLDLSFVDLDAAIEAQAGQSISALFEQSGEAAFRALEAKQLQRLLRQERLLLSTGGGTPAQGRNMELIRQQGLSIYLKLSPAALKSRLLGAQQQRPLIANTPPEQLEAQIAAMLEQRVVYYEQADLIEGGLNLSAAALDELAQRIREAWSSKFSD